MKLHIFLIYRGEIQLKITGDDDGTYGIRNRIRNDKILASVFEFEFEFK